MNKSLSVLLHFHFMQLGIEVANYLMSLLRLWIFRYWREYEFDEKWHFIFTRIEVFVVDFGPVWIYLCKLIYWHKFF